jgi:PAS domain S-box-containing protein
LIIESETSLFDQLFHATQAGLAIADDNGKIVEVNDSFAKLVERSRAELLKGDISDLLPEGTVTGRSRIPNEWLFKAASSSIRIVAAPLPGDRLALTATPVQERGETQQRLQAIEQSLSLAMQGGKLGVWSRDFRTGQVVWSPELEAIFGLEPGTFAKNEAAFFELVHPDDKARISEAIERSIKNGEAYSVEFRFHHADGSVGWMVGRGRVILDGEDKPVFMAGVGIDITDQKQSEKALETSKSSYRHLVEVMPAAVCTCGEDGVIDFYNARAAEIWGRSPVIPDPSEKFCGSFQLYTLDGDLIPIEQNPVAICLRTGEPFRGVQARVVRPDGTSVTVEVNIDPFVDDEGKVVGAINVFLDVSQRVKDREEMQVLSDTARILGSTLELPEIYDRLQALVASKFDCDNMLVTSYDAGKNLMTCSYAFMEGARTDVSVFPAMPLAPEGRGMQSTVIRTGKPLVINDAREGRKICTKSVIIDPDGRVHDEPEPPEPETKSIVMAPIKVNDKVTGVVQVMSNRFGAYTDDNARLLEGMVQQMAAAVQNAELYLEAQREIAERKRLESELERRVRDRTAELEAANGEMEGFTYSVSHDLRAPLRAIISGAMILLEDHRDQVTPLAREELTRMANASSKLGRLIDDLLQYSRLGRTEIARRKIDLSAFARDIVDTIASRHPKKIDVEIEDGMVGRADPLLLRLALENLVDNAYKYAGKSDSARIWIGREPSEDKDVYFIRDNGVGFDPQYAHKIFMPFERLFLDSEFPGNGIGLANVKRIFERHGGKVWAKSQPGAGATFYFTLG